MQAMAPVLMMMFSVLVPSKVWFAPDQPLTFTIKSDKNVKVALTDFAGKVIDPKANADVPENKPFDAKEIFPVLATPGTYILYAQDAKETKALDQGGFLGTPVVISVRSDARRGAPEGPMVAKVEPLRYAVMSTDAGDLTMAFYYDVAPNTADNFLTLAEGGYYDGL